MKYFVLSTAALLAGNVNASLDAMTGTLVAGTSGGGIESGTAVNGVGDKTFVSFIEAILEAIDGYGCWCNFNELSVNGKGPVVNTVDSYCKSLALGYQCAISDGCADPWFQAYTPFNLLSDDPVVDQCVAFNSENCEIYLCIVEGHFTKLIFDDFINSVVYDPTYKHDGGFFDPDTACAVSAGAGGPSEKECCGNYPYRFPYKTYSGERSCCGQKTYNVFNKCCEDESTSLLLSAGSCT